MIESTKRKDIDILETKGLWKASSFIRKTAEKLKKKNQSVNLGIIKQAHSLIFEFSPSKTMGGKYRGSGVNNYMKRVDGSTLHFAHWTKIPEQIAVLESDIKALTSNPPSLKTNKGLTLFFQQLAAVIHRFVQIHPFENGNGRASRLLTDVILLRVGLSESLIAADSINKEKYRKAMLQADNGDMSALEYIIQKGIIVAQAKKIKEKERAEKAFFNKRRKRVK